MMLNQTTKTNHLKLPELQIICNWYACMCDKVWSLKMFYTFLS